MDNIPLSRPLILDGATGSELLKRGMPAGVCTEQWVLDRPGVLLGLQREYVAAGSDIILAPTFCANAIKLEEYGLADKVEEYNHRLVALAKEAADGKAWVAGDMAPTGKFIQPFGELEFEDLVKVYRQQAAALEDAGVDLFMVETSMTMPDVRAAVLAIREVSEKPVFVSFTCDENGRTLSGTDVLAALIVMQGMGVNAFGLNCSCGPDQMLEQIRRLTPYARVPLLAKPNAGLPEMENGEAHYHCSPKEFCSYTKAMAEAGVRIFGGCCGTTPDHIAALKETVSQIDFGALPTVEHDPDVIPCASETEARFITPDVDVGETIECSSDLMEDILEAEENCPQGALKIDILEEDDLTVFAENQYAIKDALCIGTDVPELLEGALRAFQGRAFWDGTEELDPEFLQKMRQKYGLVLL